jgi:DNA-binding SARP family transcriptional activator
MTGKMGQQLTGYGSAARILSYLNHRHYFLETCPDAEQTFRYHGLFREFLLSRGKKECSPAELSRIRKTASKVLEESGQIEDAVSLLREDGEWEGLARVIQAHARRLLRQGRGQILLEWIKDLPKEMVRKNPWLIYWMGMCRLPFAPGESRILFEYALRGFQVRSDPEGEFLSWAGIVDSIVYGPGNLKSLEPWFLTLAELRKNHPVFPSHEIEARVTCTALKAFALSRPSSVDMEKWAGRAIALARSTGDMALRFSLLLKVAYHCFHGGDLQAFGFQLDSLRGLSRNPEITPLSRLELCWLEAAHANLTGEHDRCRKVVAEGLALSEATGIRLMDFLLMGHGALCSLHQGDQSAAEGFLRKMAAALPQARPWEASFYHFLISWNALHKGNQAQALFHSDRCLALCEEVGNPWAEALARLQRAFVLDRKGESAEASRQLEHAFRIGEESRMEFVRFAFLLAKAYFSLRKGDEEGGLASLKEGLRLGREKGFVDVYLWSPGLLERIAVEALERGIEKDYVRDLVRKHALVLDGAIHYTEDWPWPLKIYTMGRFALVRDGEKISFSRRAQQKPLQLLKALIAMGGRNVSKEHLTEVLWAEADGDMADQSFATTLGRLRKLLGHEKALVLSDGRLTLCNRHCWVDVWAFERILGQCYSVECWKGKLGKREADCARLVEKAIAIYQGPFLDGETFCSCLETSRERLRSKFLRCVEAAGRHLEDSVQWGNALAYYQKGLEVDDLAEGFYRRQMICHQKLGQATEGIAVYRRCKKTLASVLGVEPSSETEAVRKSLLTR